MSRVSRRELTPKTAKTIVLGFKRALKELEKEEDAQAFLYEFLTPQEKIMLAKRLAIGILLYHCLYYREICELLKVTPSTVQKVKLEMEKSLKYKKLFEQLSEGKELENLRNLAKKPPENPK